MTEALKPHDAREAALKLLARREHAYQELVYKLTRRGWPEDMVREQLDVLAGANLQSDERFTESYVRSRAGKGFGPVRIRAELAERGIDRALAQRGLAAAEIDWFACAADWYQRRYGEKPVADLKEKSRRQQALARRGFSHEHVRELLD